MTEVYLYFVDLTGRSKSDRNASCKFCAKLQKASNCEASLKKSYN